MPRLLPRLIEEVQRARAKIKSNSKPFHGKRKTRGSLTGPVNSSRTSFSFRGRKTSLLLDGFNPILHQERFSYQKLKKRPVLNLSQGSNEGNNEYMSLAERGFSSNPYLKMLSSPIRRCILTDKHLPIDFMIRLTILQVTSNRTNEPYIALFPKGLERCRGRDGGRSHYILCYKLAVEACISGGRKLRHIPYSTKVHSLLAEQIGHQLRNRVLSELELLTERLRCSSQKSREVPIARKLTRTELEDIKISGRVSQPGAIAVLIVPPVQKSTLARNQEWNSKESPTHPLSKLYPNTTISDSSFALHTPQSLHMVPLYNGVTLFPSPHSRHLLHQRLQALLTVERNARWRENTSISHGNLGMKSSHAYIIFADPDTIQRSDSTLLAIALWRLRLWEGQGWDDSNGDYGGWVANQG